MNALLAWFVRNPVAANLLMVIIVAGGFLAITTIDNEFFPPIEPNIVRVSVPYPGAGPLEVEEQICIKIEEALSDVQGIKEIRSSCAQGIGTVTIETVMDWDVQRMVNDVKSRVDAIPTFPADAERPIVSDLNFGNSVMQLVVFGGDDEQAIKDLALDVKDGINLLHGVNQVNVAGTRDSMVLVEIDEATLRSLGLSFDRVATAIREGSLNLPAGQMRNDAGDIQLQIRGQNYQARDFADLVVIGDQQGGQVRLGDIAVLRDSFEEKNFLVEYEGQLAVRLTVLVGDSPDTIGTSQRVREHLSGLSLPPGYQVAVVGDNAVYLYDRLQLLAKNSLQGLMLVFVLLLLFLRPRLALWVAAGIGVAYLGTLWVMAWIGVTLNVMSTFAFLLILGIVVDDAIVVSENIYARHERGLRGPQAAIDGVGGVAKPVLLAVATTMMVFVPMLSLPGPMGQFMGPMPVVALAALAFSLVECMLILPSHLSHLPAEKPPANAPARWLAAARQRFTHGLNRFSFQIYQPLLKRCLANRAATLAAFAVILAFCLSLFAGGWLNVRFNPEIEGESLVVDARFQEGTGFAHVLRAKEQIMAGIEEVREQADVVGHRGEPAIVGAFLQVDGDRVAVSISLINNGDRDIGSNEISRRIRAAIGDIPGIKSFGIAGQFFGASKDISLRLAGSDFEQLDGARLYLREALAGYQGVVDITDSQSSARQEISIRLKPHAETLGLDLNDVARQVRHAFYGAEAQRIPRLREDVRVLVRYPQDQRGSVNFLDDMHIRLGDGRGVPFSEVATAEFMPGYTTINRTDRQRVISVQADVVPGVVGAGEIVEAVMRDHREELRQRFPGVSLGLEGDQMEIGILVNHLVMGAVLALLAMYTILAVEFKSYLQPFYVLIAVPFGAAGAIIGHMVMGMDFSMPSAMGILATAGVVVNGNLVLIDFINKRRVAGEGIVEAVTQAARERLRPILLTTITTFFGLMPILLEPSPSAAALKPLVVSLSFGVVFSIGITLLMVPVLYVTMENFKARLGIRARAEMVDA